MNPRQRVLAAGDHRGPDRVPIDLGSCIPTGTHIQAYERPLKVLDVQEEVRLWEVVKQLAEPSVTVLNFVRADVRGVRVGGSTYAPQVLSQDTIRDRWGTVWHRPRGASCYSIVFCPLRDATPKDLGDHAWPCAPDPSQMARSGKKAHRPRETTSYAIVREVSGHILLRPQMIRGFDIPFFWTWSFSQLSLRSCWTASSTSKSASFPHSWMEWGLLWT